jgi:hypothetical protein
VLTQLPIQWMPGAASLGVKRPGRKANYSSSSNAEVKYGKAILPLTDVPSFPELGQLYILIIPLVGGRRRAVLIPRRQAATSSPPR